MLSPLSSKTSLAAVDVISITNTAATMSSDEEEIDSAEEEEVSGSEEEEEVVVKPRKKKGKKHKDPNKPKRNMSAFFLYSNAHRQRVKDENPGIKFGDVVSV